MSMSKTLLKQNRSILGIVRDILQACMDAGINGILVSKISQRANLSYGKATHNCQKLIDAGLIKSVRNKRSYIFMITEKGIQVFQEFQKFHDVAKEINVRF